MYRKFRSQVRIMRRFNQDGKPEDVSVKASSCNGFNPVELGGGAL